MTATMQVANPVCRKAYTSDLTDAQWKLIASMLVLPEGGRPRTTNMREVFNATPILRPKNTVQAHRSIRKNQRATSQSGSCAGGSKIYLALMFYMMKRLTLPSEPSKWSLENEAKIKMMLGNINKPTQITTTALTSMVGWSRRDRRNIFLDDYLLAKAFAILLKVTTLKNPQRTWMRMGFFEKNQDSPL